MKNELSDYVVNSQGNLVVPHGKIVLFIVGFTEWLNFNGSLRIIGIAE